MRCSVNSAFYTIVYVLCNDIKLARPTLAIDGSMKDEQAVKLVETGYDKIYRGY